MKRSKKLIEDQKLQNAGSNSAYLKKINADAKEENIDAKNLSNIKIDLSKGDPSLLNKEGNAGGRGKIYKGMELLSSDEKKKFRGGIRKDLKNFMKSILGKDRKDEERKESIIAFMEFYKENWIIQDFKIESFSNSSNSIDRKDYIDLLSYLKSIIS